MAIIDFKKIWDDNEDDFLKLLSIPSTYDEKTISKAFPYGENIALALDFMKEKCQSIGLKVQEFDGQAISASVGRGKRIDIVSHLDVVKPGAGWDSNPFNPISNNKEIIARGSQDMKSGAWLTYLCFKILKDQNVDINKELRLVYGTDEERTMNDMRYYIDKAGYPDFAFTPDGTFPITTGEKGALMWIIKGQYEGNIVSLQGGVQPNVISPYAKAEVKNVDKQKVLDLLSLYQYQAKVSELEDKISIEIIGKAGHASRPEHGENANVYLLHILSELLQEDSLKKLYQVFKSPYGEGTSLFFDIKPMGKLTLNPGLISIKNNEFTMYVDCRYPYGVSSKTLNSLLQNNLQDFEISLPYDDEPTYVDDEDVYIKALKNAYTKVTNDPCPSMISGGVSYSKVFKHCVAFGPVYLSNPMAHQKNEAILKEDLYKALEIYYYSLLNILEGVK